jgi:HSP20 family protein
MEENRMKTVVPRADIYKEDNSVHMYLEMPGVTKDAVELRVEDSKLHIEARREHADQTGKYLYRSRFNEGYQRAYVLEDTIDTESIKAEFEDGVLHIELGYRPESSPRKIQIA